MSEKAQQRNNVHEYEWGTGKCFYAANLTIMKPTIFRYNPSINAADTFALCSHVLRVFLC